MATKLELVLEAERRGILPKDKQVVLDEAKSRGLVTGSEPSAATIPAVEPSSGVAPTIPAVQPAAAESSATKTQDTLDLQKRPQTIQQKAKEVFGFKDFETRGTILPFGRTEEGETELATPQILVDMLTAALLPGFAAEGGAVSPEDAALFAMEFAAPFIISRGIGAAATRSGRSQFVKAAPSTEDLKVQSVGAKGAAKSSGVVVDADAFTDFVASTENAVRNEKLNQTLHPKSSAVFEILQGDVGKPLDVGDLIIVRRLLGTAQRSVDPDLADDRRIAGMMQDALDNFVDNLGPDSILAGNTAKLGENLATFRGLWARAKKSETIVSIIEKAASQASGFENGIRVGFRQLLNNKKQIKGFKENEIKMMQEIVSGGTSGVKVMRLLGKLSFGTRGGSNFLGGTIGVAVGSQLAGTVGAIAAPAIGQVAQAGVTQASRKSADLVRAAVATGKKPPPAVSPENLPRAAGPLVATELDNSKKR